MTEEEYRQEFEAEFIDGVETVFAGVDACIKGTMLHQGRPGVKYITGIDLGQKQNFTVLCSLACDTQQVEGFARFNQMDWREQEKNIFDHLKRFPGPAVVDATGVGQPIFETIRRDYRDHVEACYFTPQRRTEMLVGLQRAFAHRRLILANETTLIAELHGFAYCHEKDAGGLRRVRMSAPSGQHDDCVMSLAMAWYGKESKALWAVGSDRNPFIDKGVYG